MLKALLLISCQNHQLVTIGPRETVLSQSLFEQGTAVLDSKILHSRSYPCARCCGFNDFENDSDPIRLMSFLHLQVPLSAHNLFPLRLFLLYLKLFLVLTAAKDNSSCLLFLCLCSVTHSFRNHSFLKLSKKL